ncbi:MAG: hypothetical protein EZS28_053945, partial [Streblomastix strix]
MLALQVVSIVLSYYPIIFLAKKALGKHRRIISCKTVNQLLNIEHFHIEGLTDARKIFINQGQAIMCDLHQAYSHLPVSTALHQYMAFRIRKQTFQYITVPFGIGTAPRLFIKVMRVGLAHLKPKEILITAQLDDGMARFQTRAQAEEGIKLITSLLTSLKLTINFQKSITIPCHTPKYL